MNKGNDNRQNDSQAFNRRSIRLREYDYARVGAYFVTVCTNRKQPLFGDINKGAIKLSEIGQLAKRCWLTIPQHFANVILDRYAIMPNHIHGIIVINDMYSRCGEARIKQKHPLYPRRGAACCAPTRDKLRINVTPGSLGAIVRSFKSAVTKAVHERHNSSNLPIWQRNYYDHVIRNEADLSEKRKYILDNPTKWEIDEYYLNGLATGEFSR